MTGADLLDRATEATLTRPRRGWALAAAGLLLTGLAVTQLELVTETREVVSTPALQTLERASELFGLGERAYVLVEAPAGSEGGDREDDLLRFAGVVRAQLEGSPAVLAVEHGLPLPLEQVVDRLVLPFGVLYFEPEALRRRLSPAGLRGTLERQVARLGLMGVGEAEAWAERDPLELHRPLLERVTTLRGALRFAPDSPHTLSEDRRALLITVIGSRGASDLAQAGRLTGDLRAAVAAALADPSARGLAVHLAGGPLLAAESQRIIAEDVTRSFGSSLALALLLLALGLRLRLRAVLLLLLPTLWGVAVGVGLFALLRGELIALALGCSATLIGLGVDFTIHLTAAARTGRAAGASPAEAVRGAVRGARGALVLATFTSLGAFLAFLTARQRFLADMGLLTACGLVACLVGALLLLPPLLARVLRVARDAERPPRSLGALAVARWCRARPRRVLAMSALLSAAAAAALVANPPQFETDLRNLQARDSLPLAAQERIAATFGGGREPLVLLVHGEDEAAALAAAQRLDPHLLGLARDGQLAARSSLAALLPSLAGQRRALDVLEEIDPARVRADLAAALQEVGFDPAAYADYVGRVAEGAALAAPLDLDALRAQGLGALVDRFLARDAEGAHALVLLYPSGDAWDPAARARAIERVREAIEAAQVEADLSGVPLVSAESAQQVADDFARVSLVTVAAVLLVLLLRLRRPGRVALALAPATLGTLWTAALLSAAGWKLSLMNLGVLPMVLAIGVDDGIHMVHRHLRMARQGEGDPHAFGATVTGILLTSLTTLVAFGGLAFSRNLGIASVGVLAAVGIAGCLVASLAVVPAALGLLDLRTVSKVEVTRVDPPGAQ